MDDRRFRNRAEAGGLLAELLRDYAGRDDVVVLALPRGGVPVGYEVAKALGAPLDVFVVRKLGVPEYEELAMGAIASGGVLVLDRHAIQSLDITEGDVQHAAEAELRELERRESAYRGDREPLDLEGKTVIVVDDGLATGSTMRAVAEAVRQLDPARIVVAVPVAAAETWNELREVLDEIVCAAMPRPFYAVGLWYDDFSQTSDEEVRGLLEQAADVRPIRARSVR
jgi:putative phosphoribosyl transferase